LIVARIRYNSILKRGALWALGLLAFWTALAVVFAVELYFAGFSGPIKLPWPDALRQALFDWLPWAALSPVIIWLATRFRLAPQSWRRSLPVHLLACVLVSIGYEAIQWSTRVNSQFFVVRSGGVAFGAGFGGSTGRPMGGIRVARPAPLPLPPDDAEIMVAPAAGAEHVTLALPPFNRTRHFFHVVVMRTQFTVPIYWCIVGVCWAANYYRELRERERRALELESRLSQANLQALKAQLQPHFLFNTLNAIAALVHKDPNAADEVLGSLSELLRMTLDASDQHEVPLRREMEFLDRYMEIQQLRFGDRLRVERCIADETLDGFVPTLILQPFVENAIRHGIELQERAGTVRISAAREGARLRLEVSDDSGRFNSGHFASKDGIGLANTKARLQALYGDRHRFTISPNQQGGLSVQLECPFHT
jgi:hypothetical protein